MTFNKPRREFRVEIKTETLCALEKWQNRSSDSLIFLVEDFNEPNSCIASYLEKHWIPLLQGKPHPGSLLELFHWLAFLCFCYYNHTKCPASENPAPLPDCGAKVPFFISQRSNLTLPPVSSCKIEEINTSLPWGWLFQGCFARFMALFTLLSLCLSLYFAFLLYFLTSPHLYSIKEPGIQPLVRWLFWDTTPQSSHSAGFPKSYSLPQYLVSQIHVTSRVSLDLVKLSWWHLLLVTN